jgi:hypothetical protein
VLLSPGTQMQPSQPSPEQGGREEAQDPTLCQGLESASCEGLTPRLGALH